MKELCNTNFRRLADIVFDEICLECSRNGSKGILQNEIVTRILKKKYGTDSDSGDQAAYELHGNLQPNVSRILSRLKSKKLIEKNVFNRYVLSVEGVSFLEDYRKRQEKLVALKI